MFYVYQLEDPETGLPFYVGKGKGNRASSHTNEVKRGRSTGNKRKDDKIAAILAKGMEPEINIIAHYVDETDAFDHEIELIATVGGLLNIRKGGEGLALAPAERERRTKIRKLKMSHAEWLRNRVKLRNCYNRISNYSGEPTEEMADWLAYAVQSLSTDVPTLESRLANI